MIMSSGSLPFLFLRYSSFSSLVPRGVVFFLYCLYKQDSVMAEAQASLSSAAEYERTGVGFIDAHNISSVVLLADDD
jgi:hypothetical protein